MVSIITLTILLMLFVTLTGAVVFCPMVNAVDIVVINFVQNLLKELPIIIPLLPDCALYSVMIALPIIGFGVYFIRQKKWLNLVLFVSIPLVTFLLNCVIKPLVHRSRPPYELQLAVHPESFSYVSSHSLVTLTLWGMVIYYIQKSNIKLWQKTLTTVFAVLWILFVGFSRIWLGVHHLTDVLGAYILGLILVFSFIKIGERL